MGVENRLKNWIALFIHFWRGDNGLAALLVVILLVFILAPLIRSGVASVIVSIFLSLLFLSAIRSILEMRLHRVGVAVLVLTGIILTWMVHVFPANRSLYTWSDLISVILLILLTIVVMRHVYQKGPVTMDRIREALGAYILVGFTWAIIYHLIELKSPGSFHFIETAVSGDYLELQSAFTYYSFITMTTVGYGDITPIHPIGRVFVVIETLIGQLYPATLLARLVSLHIIQLNEEGSRAKAGRERSGDETE